MCKMNRIRLFILCLGMIFLFSCKDDDDSDKDMKANLPKLSVDSVSMLGIIGLNNALIFSIDDVPFIGLGYMPLMGKNSYFYYYVPESRSWEQVAVEYPGGSREEAVAFVIGHKAYVGLGYTAGKTDPMHYYDDFYVYDSDSKTWELLAFEFPGESRAGAVAFSIGGKGYVGTGFSENAYRLSDFYEFDPVTGWKQVTNIGYARAGAHAFVANGYGYVCFGDGANDVQKFDPELKTWKSQPIWYDKDETEKLHSSLTASFVINKDGEDFVYLWGNERWGYNPRENVWKKVKYPIGGEYGFTIGGRGFSMSMYLEEGAFKARIFEVIN